MLLQAPGVTQDTAERDKLHVRNEHGNLQFRINGIALPEGAGAFGQFLDTAIVGQLDLMTGALPAQFGQWRSITGCPMHFAQMLVFAS